MHEPWWAKYLIMGLIADEVFDKEEEFEDKKIVYLKDGQSIEIIYVK